jgi:hypothetical protein
MEQYDAILVPGGGVREGGLLPSWVRRRLDRAVELWRDEYIVTLSAGATHRAPPLDAGGFPIFESVAGARYLVEAGVPPERILVETCSYDTIGNAYFSRVIHVDPRCMRRLLVITSDFHMPRTQAVFLWMYSLTPKPTAYDLDFDAVDDPTMPADVYGERRRKEQENLEDFVRTKDRIATIGDCHRWLFSEHQAYNAERRGFGLRTLSKTTLTSY